ncbi:response regulator [Cohnella endophytica]|uniref:Response regulator n=1 Tax=Cohnella endophytica TaxID=2419778 RepID=A0A494XL51_9BACL|nr:response regulator [Cohnella endophytica]RKP48869.1 response regulator [Cohnella endophytica]
MEKITKPIKVLIADDESIVRKGLQATVPWAAYGMEVVADAPNGRKAWEAFLEHRPEIVITDIVMPEMDGIELSRKVKEAEPDTRIVLLSCHRDFEYAKEGLKLGASGYLLKTAFEDDELEVMLGKFQRELSVSRDVPIQATEPNTETESAEDKSGTMLYAWLTGHSDKFAREMESRSGDRWNWGDQPVYAYLIKTAGSGTTWQQLVAGAEWADGLRRDGAMIDYGEERCYWLVPESMKEAADGLLVENKGQFPLLHWAKRGPLLRPEDRLEAISSLHGEAELEKTYGVSLTDWPSPIRKAVKLLCDNPAADWSVSDVAGQVGLSRSHFSIMFKKAVGDSFVAFQYKRKLKLAYGYLKDTTLTMQEIAERTGLGDSKYFSKWFKRCTGTTPSHYRAQQKDGASRTE